MRKRGVLIVPDRVNRAAYKLACQVCRSLADEHAGTGKELWWTYQDREGEDLISVHIVFPRKRKKPRPI